MIKSFGGSLNDSFSNYSATLNSISQAAWPLFTGSSPLKINLSHKSCLRSLDSPALLSLRTRAIFGTGARADLITFFLTHPTSNFSASDLTEISYSKRNLAEILEEFCLSGLFDKYMVRNQHRFRLIKNDSLIKVIGSIPEFTPSWHRIFEFLLQLRHCINSSANYSESTRVIIISNFLMNSQKKLEWLNISVPNCQADFHSYLNSFSEWLIEIVSKLAQGDFPDKSFLTHPY